MNARAQTQLRSVLGPAKFNYWYETIIDLMIANPDMKQGERAARLGRTQAWMSLIENSHGFRERYALRRAEHSARISQNIEDKLHNVTSLALDKLTDALATKDIKPELALQATDTLLQRLGYSGKPQTGAAAQQSGPMVVQIIAPVSAEVLKTAQTSIRAYEESTLNAPPAQVQLDSNRQQATPARSSIDYEAPEAEIVETPRKDDPAFRRDSAE
jgi:hypothetical protein